MIEEKRTDESNSTRFNKNHEELFSKIFIRQEEEKTLELE